MDPEQQPIEEQQEEEFESSDAESDEAGRDTDVSDSWGALPSTTQQMLEQLDAVAAKHARRGDQAVANAEWQQAVHHFTSALKCTRDVQQEAALLSRRSQALCNMCKHIRSIPARTSERRALYGHDPTHLAQLALKDAEKAAHAAPTCAELYVHQGTALFLLERYSDAESAYLEGLALQPAHKTLQDGLQQVQEVLAEQEKEQQQLLAEVRRTGVAAAATTAAAAAASSGAADAEKQAGASSAAGRAAAAAAAAAGGSSSSPSRAYAEGPGSTEAAAAAAAAGGSAAKRQRRLALSADTADDCECILCLKLLYEPVTTPCGHTFCKGCFARSMDHGNRCPMCRTALHVSRELPVSITLQNILARAYPQEYAARAAEIAGAAAAEAAAAAAAGGVERLSLPLFVMSTLLPGETMALNIFEPRYRLMVRRTMEGNRRLGMATVGRSGPDGLDELAVEAEITDCQLQPDGRYYLEMVGRRRIKITSTRDLDGYRVAAAELFKDTTPQPAAAAVAADAPAGENAADVTDSVSNTVSNNNDSLQELAESAVAAADGLLDRVRGVLASRRVGPGQIRELFDRIGNRPPVSDAEAVSWWASRLLLLLVPSNTERSLIVNTGFELHAALASPDISLVYVARNITLTIDTCPFPSSDDLSATTIRRNITLTIDTCPFPSSDDLSATIIRRNVTITSLPQGAPGAADSAAAADPSSSGSSDTAAWPYHIFCNYLTDRFEIAPGFQLSLSHLVLVHCRTWSLAGIFRKAKGAVVRLDHCVEDFGQVCLPPDVQKAGIEAATRPAGVPAPPASQPQQQQVALSEPGSNWCDSAAAGRTGSSSSSSALGFSYQAPLAANSSSSLCTQQALLLGDIAVTDTATNTSRGTAGEPFTFYATNSTAICAQPVSPDCIAEKGPGGCLAAAYDAINPDNHAPCAVTDGFSLHLCLTTPSVESIMLLQSASMSLTTCPAQEAPALLTRNITIFSDPRAPRLTWDCGLLSNRVQLAPNLTLTLNHLILANCSTTKPLSIVRISAGWSLVYTCAHNDSDGPGGRVEASDGLGRNISYTAVRVTVDNLGLFANTTGFGPKYAATLSGPAPVP
ncbi:hypothetical protein OEZ85_005596 [Tetradesmus obliquus]|uniref:RING-type domain-containing protein n=1 Tax=Tetradesmus obliquus TaxID=3088 RepID=A0ABY8UEF4_TETOB|nr:hypothetical protein OEZ85_005596 [Tetradesmus obliquus]